MQTPSIQHHHPDRPRPPAARRTAGRALFGLVAVVTALVAPTLSAAPASAGQLALPYRNDFSSAAGGTLSGDAAVTGGALRLTEDAEGQAGAWSTDDTFPSTAGLVVSFRYDTGAAKDNAADGLVLSLSDGAAQQGVGQYGAGLGYSCRNTTNQGAGQCDGPGLPGAFAGVALDQYGNFSLPFNGSGPGRTPGSVVVRGAGDGTTGYRYVAGAQLPGGVDSHGGWRDVRVVVQPGDDDTIHITVQVSDGGALETVLDRVALGGPGQPALPPTMRLGFSGSTGSVTSLHRVDDLSVRQPADIGIHQDLPTAVAGTEWSYTVHVDNSGGNPSDPSPVHVTVPTLLQGATWTCTASDGATCGDASGSGDIDSTVGLPRGSSADYVITGTLAPDASGDLLSDATLDVATGLFDTHQADNAASASTPVTAAASMSTEKSVATLDGADGVAPGDDVEYTVTAVNDGPSTARDVTVADDLPGQLTFSGSADGCTATGQHVVCGGSASLAPGEELPFRFRATLDPDYDGDGSDVVNVAVAGSPTDGDGGDPSPEVPLPPVHTGDPGDPDPDPEPSPDPDTTGPTHPGDDGDRGDGGDGRDDGTTPGAGGAGGAGAPTAGHGSGALAFTGSESVGALLGVAAMLAAGGLLVARMGRRRWGGVSPAPSDEEPTGS